MDREDIEAVVQVVAELAFGLGLLRRAVGRRDDAHVGRHRLGRADANEGAGLEHAQQLDLQVQGHLGDLVQKDRAALRLLEEAAVLAVGAGEAALLVTEQLALDQVGRDRAAVDREERKALAPAQVVDRPRGELLASAALAGQQHGG